MYNYIKGEIVDIQNTYIVVDNHGIGYLLHVSNPYSFTKNTEVLVYVYQQVKEDSIVLFGFSSAKEKDLFLKLILVKGIGCKTALGMLAVGDVTSMMQAIESANISYLKKIPGIGPKAAQQIVLDLQGKLQVNTLFSNHLVQELEEAGEVLLALGYKQKDVDSIKQKLANKSLDTNGYVKEALRLLVK